MIVKKCLSLQRKTSGVHYSPFGDWSSPPPSPQGKNHAPRPAAWGVLVALRPSATGLPLGNSGSQVQKGGVVYE